MGNPGLEQRWPQMVDPSMTPHQRDMLNKYAGAAFWRVFKNPTKAAKDGMLDEVVEVLAEIVGEDLVSFPNGDAAERLLAQTKESA